MKSRNTHGCPRRTLIFLGLCWLLVPGALAATEPERNSRLEPLEWLVGDWEGDFLPPGAGEEPTMRFEWGDEKRSYLRMTGTTPTPDGTLVPEYETSVVWHHVQNRIVFLGTYWGGNPMEDGDIEVLPDGGLRLNMRVHYPAGTKLPFSDGAQAGRGGHTLEFRRTFRREGEDRLRGEFLMKRGPVWENPHPSLDATVQSGYLWHRKTP